ncbi:Serine--tRNA ligase, cytoplasmic [Armadillidium nasatum]|uniref:Serine--tRNA ligase, cytoplasmic n=1 Tax=Armadillidium nasatum TaxID=96803 RepID=A0A5N5SYL8_9CRUS|nr:Serine--tRNA ligase, cytoplasmic [Armadillidium nasatum]
MLDIVLFREDQGGNPEIIRESQRKRYKDVGTVDEIISLDTKWRATSIMETCLTKWGTLYPKLLEKRKRLNYN